MKLPRLFSHNGSLASTSGVWVNLSGLMDITAYESIQLSAIGNTAYDLRTLQCIGDIPVEADTVLSVGAGLLPNDGVESPAFKERVILQYRASSSVSTAVIELTGKLPYGFTQ